ncbi:MAG: PAS domain-containing sensor histidine kinase [Pseudomonadota bacterium]
MTDYMGQAYQNAAAPASQDSPTNLSALDDRSMVRRLLGPGLVVLSIVCAVITFAVLTGSTSIVPTRQVVVWSVAINASIVLALVVLISLEVSKLLRARKDRKAGARLHLRLLGLFSFIAAVPAVIVAIVATITLDRGMDRWFSERTQSMVDFSIVVARAYLDEYRQVLNIELNAVSSELNRSKALFDFDPERFQTYMSDVAAIRNVPYMSLVGGDGIELLRANTRFAEGYRRPDPADLALVTGNEPVLIPPGDTNQIAGLIRLPEFDDHYLFIARAVDPRVVQYLLVTEQNAAEFEQLQNRRFGVQLSFGFMFVGLALIMLLAAMWIALSFADRLVLPVRRLMIAAKQISTGNLYVQVPVRRVEGDLADLGETFNRMANDLRSQRNELMNANDLLDARRRFTEAVLAGVSAGVVGIDRTMHISLVNRSASQLLGVDDDQLMGRKIAAAVPEFASILPDTLNSFSPRRSPSEVRLERDGNQRILTVMVTVETADDGSPRGAVLTFDDVSDLVAAQRSSAWADIARRIAHEIKNPLTPIQLSAERLKRRYGRKLTEDADVFEQCTDTIIRQVGDIGRMVDEFSSFARMPKPEFQSASLTRVIDDTTFLMANGYPDISVTARADEGIPDLMLDTRLVGQVITNIIKNAAEGIATKREKTAQVEQNSEQPQSIVLDTYLRDDGYVVLEISDTGIGFPDAGRAKLLEPYMTTRAKGTGLGLAIVKRIVEDHGGRLSLLNADQGRASLSGAMVRLEWPTDLLAATSEGGDRLPIDIETMSELRHSKDRENANNGENAVQPGVAKAGGSKTEPAQTSSAKTDAVAAGAAVMGTEQALK